MITPITMPAMAPLDKLDDFELSSVIGTPEPVDVALGASELEEIVETGIDVEEDATGTEDDDDDWLTTTEDDDETGVVVGVAVGTADDEGVVELDGGAVDEEVC